jgi:hypothetical protein
MQSEILIILVGVLKAISDLSSEGNKNLPIQFHKSKSWMNKWKTPLQPYTGNKLPYLFIFAPKYKEKFYLSSTWLVSLTDFWHKIELLRIVCVILLVVSYKVQFNFVIDFLYLYLLRNIGFHFTYTSIKR